MKQLKKAFMVFAVISVVLLMVSSATAVSAEQKLTKEETVKVIAKSKGIIHNLLKPFAFILGLVITGIATLLCLNSWGII